MVNSTMMIGAVLLSDNITTTGAALPSDNTPVTGAALPSDNTRCQNLHYHLIMPGNRACITT